MGRQSLESGWLMQSKGLSPCPVQPHGHRSERQVFPGTARPDLLGPGRQRQRLPGALVSATTRRRRPALATVSAHAPSGALGRVARWQSKNGGGDSGGGGWSEAQGSPLRPPPQDPRPLQPACFSKRAHRQQAPYRVAGRRPAPHRRAAQERKANCQGADQSPAGPWQLLGE